MQKAGIVTAIVQVRLGSMRLPKKALLEVSGKTLIEHLLERLNRSRQIDRVVLAIPHSSANDPLAEFAVSSGCEVSRGSEIDVLDRFVRAAQEFPSDAFVRVTGDCPLIDPDIVDQLISGFYRRSVSYARTGLTFPDGLDAEIFTSDALKVAGEQAREEYDREHVTPFMQREMAENSWVLESAKDFTQVRVTVDEPEDLLVIEAVLAALNGNSFTYEQLGQLIETSPEMFLANSHIPRNEGSKINSGQKLWKRAQRVIPAGNSLLSKNPAQFSGKAWPGYYSRSDGCRVWDIDGNPYLDVGYMGIGTNILGYRNTKVDQAVVGAVEAGNLTTLNCPEEVLLAEELCDIHRWAEMCMFTRSGGEAAAVAVRLSRAASGKSGIAICGYHGWHDWYLSANLQSEESLDNHLLRGLSTDGVPIELLGTAKTFAYNDLGALKEILREGKTGTIIMEVERNFAPSEGFLEGVRLLADEYGAVLIFDECTSGFREVMGGLHLKYGVEPDMLILGKTLGNGYAINSVLGRRNVMETRLNSFISSTFWTERIGPSAALAALKEMQDVEAPRRIDRIGRKVRESWAQLAGKKGLPIVISGLPALSTFTIEGFNHLEVKTFVVESLLSRGFLGATAFYASIAHGDQVIDSYLSAVDEVFGEIARLGPEGLGSALPNGIAASGFSRLN